MKIVYYASVFLILFFSAEYVHAKEKIEFPVGFFDQKSIDKDDVPIGWLYVDENKKDAVLVRIDNMKMVGQYGNKKISGDLSYVHHKATRKPLPIGLFEWKWRKPGVDLKPQDFHHTDKYPYKRPPDASPNYAAKEIGPESYQGRKGTALFGYNTGSNQVTVSPNPPIDSPPYFKPKLYWGEKLIRFDKSVQFLAELNFRNLDDLAIWKEPVNPYPSQLVRKWALETPVEYPRIRKKYKGEDLSGIDFINMEREDPNEFTSYEEMMKDLGKKNAPFVILRLKTGTEKNPQFNYYLWAEKQLFDVFGEKPTELFYYVSFSDKDDFEYLTDFVSAWDEKTAQGKFFSVLIKEAKKSYDYEKLFDLKAINKAYEDFLTDVEFTEVNAVTKDASKELKERHEQLKIIAPQIKKLLELYFEKNPAAKKIVAQDLTLTALHTILRDKDVALRQLFTIPTKYFEQNSQDGASLIGWLYVDAGKKDAVLIRIDNPKKINDTISGDVSYIHHLATRQALSNGLYQWKSYGEPQSFVHSNYYSLNPFKKFKIIEDNVFGDRQILYNPNIKVGSSDSSDIFYAGRFDQGFSDKPLFATHFKFWKLTGKQEEDEDPDQWHGPVLKAFPTEFIKTALTKPPLEPQIKKKAVAVEKKSVAEKKKLGVKELAAKLQKTMVTQPAQQPQEPIQQMQQPAQQVQQQTPPPLLPRDTDIGPLSLELNKLSQELNLLQQGLAKVK